MKKIVLIALLIVAAVSAKAQVYVGGSLGFWHNGNDTDVTSFTIAPEVGYNFNEKWAIGAAIDYTYGKVNSITANSIAVAPYARFSYYKNDIVRLFIDGGFGVSSVSYKGGDSTTGAEIGLKPGIAFEASKHFSVVAKVGFLGWRQDYALASDGYGLMLSSEDLSLGFHYEF